ncbi:hypothetical protein [Methyloversatilis sp.]|uniref:hypothetical protein n=1 Tax=Methyloversatilis sp. TaxID=2569862 RepID=UPI0027B8D36E|nr:hypothetical protein [Methyloversatilis sp.]
MGIKNSVEYLYLTLMLRWEENAPPDKHEGLLDGASARNTQITRMAYILRKIAAGQEDHTYQLLSRHTRRNDGRSYISTDSSWMTEPYPLSSGWFFEGCTSLIQKQGILQNLSKLGLSPTLIDCIDEFVAGKGIKGRIPSEDEAEEILRRSIEMERLKIDANDA